MGLILPAQLQIHVNNLEPVARFQDAEAAAQKAEVAHSRAADIACLFGNQGHSLFETVAIIQLVL